MTSKVKDVEPSAQVTPRVNILIRAMCTARLCLGTCIQVWLERDWCKQLLPAALSSACVRATWTIQFVGNVLYYVHGSTGLGITFCKWQLFQVIVELDIFYWREFSFEIIFLTGLGGSVRRLFKTIGQIAPKSWRLVGPYC